MRAAHCSEPLPGHDDCEKDRAAESHVVDWVGELRNEVEPEGAGTEWPLKHSAKGVVKHGEKYEDNVEDRKSNKEVSEEASQSHGRQDVNVKTITNKTN